MKLTIVGDPHAKNDNLDLISELQHDVEDLGNSVIWLGDMLDTKEVIRGKCLNAWFDYFSRSRLQHTVMVGNHDWFNLSCEDHALRTLGKLPNVKIVDEPQTFLCSPKILHLLPYIHDVSDLRQALSLIPAGATVFAHIDTSGFDYGNGHVCKNGISLTEDLHKFHLVVSGHFHKFQEKGNLVYLGTPFSHSFGEANQQKYLGIYDSETGELTKHPTKYRKHLSIEFNCDLLDEGSTPQIFDTQDPHSHIHKYRVILTGTQESINRFPRHEYEDSKENLDIKWIIRPSDFQLNDVSISDTVSNEKQFLEWASRQRDFEQKGTIQLGLQILESVR